MTLARTIKPDKYGRKAEHIQEGDGERRDTVRSNTNSESIASTVN